MFFKKVTLDGYIPFTHVGNRHVEIEFDQAATAIIGSNGCGKSSLLSQMTPLPATRTDYLKDGRIEKIIEHDGHIFTLTSDFKNPTAPHSFKKDDVELNLSGTTDTQRDLVYEHLGVNQMILDIMAGNIHICEMQKSLRKQLFSATYPSDLSFVLEYHKKVCSQIRAFSNQIKLLQGREGSLMASLISDSERCYMDDYRECYTELLNRIDRANLILENEINQLKQHPVMQEKRDFKIELQHGQEMLKMFTRRYQRLLMSSRVSRKFGEHPTLENLTEKRTICNQQLGFLIEKKTARTKELETIRDELNKFLRIRDTPASDKKDELANELLLIAKEMDELKANPSWQNIPAVQADKMTTVDQLIPDLNTIVTSLHPYAGQLIGQEEISRIQSECDTFTFSVSSLMSEKVGLEQQLAQQKSRKEMMTQNSYPKDCSRVCGLRATLEASVRDIDLRCAEIEARLKKIYEDVDYQNKHLEANKKKLLEISPAIPILKRLYDKLSENYLVDLALNGESFLDCVNNHIAEIPNRIIKGLESSKIYYRYKELYDRSEQIKSTLAMMKTSESVNLSLEVIKSMIEDRQQKLDEGIKGLDDLQRQTKALTFDLDCYDAALCDLREMNNLIGEIEYSLNIDIISNRIEFDQKMIDEHLALKNEISTRLREIEHTLEEQKRINDILETEIKPTLESLRKQRMDWELVEIGLSPTKGLPCIYLVRFMNRLISRANMFIKEIWYSDMELAYVEEKDNLDFSIGVIFNKSTTAKDISLCSKGQKAIVDFAFTLALATERGFLKWMPLICDEIDGPLTEAHRTTLVALINRLLEDGIVKQMFLVNHFGCQTGFSECDIVCLCTDGIVVPGEYNTHAKIE